jgi:hypothetical protein
VNSPISENQTKKKKDFHFLIIIFLLNAITRIMLVEVHIYHIVIQYYVNTDGSEVKIPVYGSLNYSGNTGSIVTGCNP